MQKFKKLYNNFSELGLDPNEQLIMTHLYDRMELSKQNNGFYDKKQHAYFVTFSREELSELLNVSLGTITRVFKSLRKKGLIITKQRFNASNRIFLPKYLECKNDEPKMQKSNSNKTEHTKTEITKDTKDTVDDARFNALKQSLKEIGGFDDRTIGILSTYSFGSYDKLYELVGTIYKSKYAVLTKNKGVSGVKLALALDYSDYFKDMHKTAKYVILHAKNAKNYHGYIFAAFKQYFENAVNYYIAQNTDNRVDIPLFKLC